MVKQWLFLLIMAVIPISPFAWASEQKEQLQWISAHINKVDVSNQEVMLSTQAWFNSEHPKITQWIIGGEALLQRGMRGVVEFAGIKEETLVLKQFIVIPPLHDLKKEFSEAASAEGVSNSLKAQFLETYTEEMLVQVLGTGTRGVYLRDRHFSVSFKIRAGVHPEAMIKKGARLLTLSDLQRGDLVHIGVGEIRGFVPLTVKAILVQEEPVKPFRQGAFVGTVLKVENLQNRLILKTLVNLSQNAQLSYKERSLKPTELKRKNHISFEIVGTEQGRLVIDRIIMGSSFPKQRIIKKAVVEKKTLKPWRRKAIPAKIRAVHAIEDKLALRLKVPIQPSTSIVEVPMHPETSFLSPFTDNRRTLTDVRVGDEVWIKFAIQSNDRVFIEEVGIFRRAN